MNIVKVSLLSYCNEYENNFCLLSKQTMILINNMCCLHSRHDFFILSLSINVGNFYKQCTSF